MSIGEFVVVIDNYTTKLKTSGYNQGQAKEIITSGIRGYKNKKKRRKREGKPFYRPARTTLKSRVRKKLMEKQTWYKKKKKNEEEDGEEECDANKKSPKKHHRREKSEAKHMLDKVQEEREGKGQEKSMVKSVIFVPNTENSELARRLREGEEDMLRLTGYKIKIVERSG